MTEHEVMCLQELESQQYQEEESKKVAKPNKKSAAIKKFPISSNLISKSSKKKAAKSKEPSKVMTDEEYAMYLNKIGIFNKKCITTKTLKRCHQSMALIRMDSVDSEAKRNDSSSSAELQKAIEMSLKDKSK